MDTWKLAYIRMNEAARIAQEEWLIRQALEARKPAKSTNKQSLRFRFEAFKGMLLCYGERFYCRTLSFINSRSN
jgi:hypothetical protein